MTYCCSNDFNYKTNGTCVEVAENTRCEKRRVNDHIALGILLAVIFIAISSCAWIKVK